MIYAGIDAGSRAIKVVLFDSAAEKVAAQGVIDQGVEQDRLALELFENTVGQAKVKRNDVRRIVATGYGRNIVSIADTTVTEITCHAVGVHHLVPTVKTLIDIGGQDSKLVKLDGGGKVRDFAMNDRCAAGTGRFLEVVAQRLGVELESVGELIEKSERPAVISSMCVVFAESEIIGLLAAGRGTADILAGVHHSIANRIAAMAGRRVEGPVVFTGGVAMIPAMAGALESALNAKITVCPSPQMTGALGAAIVAARQGEGLEA